MIQFEQVSKAFGSLSVLKEISLEIAPGSRFCLIGRSGSGKSVLIKLMLGLLAPDQGKIFIEGKHIAQFKPEDWNRVLEDFGVVYQGAALFDSLSIYENVGIKLIESRKDSIGHIQARVVDALEKVGLSAAILNKFPSELSGGMRKRVGIARAIIHRPKYLIYDEPGTGLDPISAGKIDDLIFELSETGDSTTLIVTHDMHSVKRLATEIAMIHDKQLYFKGKLSQFVNSELLEIQQFLARG